MFPGKAWQLPGATGRKGELWKAVNNAQGGTEGYFCSSQCKEQLECPAQNKPSTLQVGQLGATNKSSPLESPGDKGNSWKTEIEGQLLARKTLNADYGHWEGPLWKCLELGEGLFNY